MDPSGAHVAVVAFPFGSNLDALLAVVRALAVAAPDALFTFLTTEKTIPPLERAVVGIGNIRFFAVADGCPSPSPPLPLFEKIGFFYGAVPGNLREGIVGAGAAAGGIPVDSVVCDSFVVASADLADEMGIPWVMLRIGGPACFAAHLHNDLIQRTIGVGETAVAGRADETLDFIPSLSAMRVRDLPLNILKDDLLKFCMDRVLDGIGRYAPHASALAMNTFEGLDPAIDADIRANVKHFLPVGPNCLLNTRGAAAADDADLDPCGCLPWLDRHPPASVAYVCFGTIVAVGKNPFCFFSAAESDELAAGIEESGAPFLWALKESMWDRLPDGFLERTKERGLVVRWAPQLQVLAHGAVGAFVTHCGWNSVLEGVSGGVPMVCRPFFGDQMTNERTVSQVLRIGVGFKGGVVTREEVVAALKTVLSEEEGKKMRQRVVELKGKAEAAVGPDGSSTRNLNKLVKILCGR